MEDLSTLDSVVLAVLGIAIVRGFWIGLIREGFSIAALGGGLLAVRYGTPPAADFIEKASQGDLGPTVSMWIAGAAIGIGVVFVIGALGKMLRRGVRAVGLGWEGKGITSGEDENASRFCSVKRFGSGAEAEAASVVAQKDPDRRRVFNEIANNPASSKPPLTEPPG